MAVSLRTHGKTAVDASGTYADGNEAILNVRSRVGSVHTPSSVNLVLVTGYPRYYHQPVLSLISSTAGINFTAVYSSAGGIIPHENGYGQPITWDRNPVEGIDYRFLPRAHLNPIEGSFLTHRDPDVLSVVKELDPDILWIFGYNSVTLQYAQIYQHLRRRPLLIGEDQNLLSKRPLWKKSAKQIGIRLMFRGAYGLYVGSENAKWFRHFGMPDDRMFFSPHTVDNEVFQKASIQFAPMKYTLRESFGISPDKGPLVLYIGRLIPKKQPLLLLRAFAEVRDQLPCSLLIVGSGEMESEMRDFISQSDIPDVYFSGFLNQSDVSKAYAAADMLVLPSGYDETWGLVVNEAMNFGLPVITSNKVGCAIDLVTPGENGYIVDSNSQAELSWALLKLIYSSNQRTAFGIRSREIITNWSPQVAADGVLRAIDIAMRDQRK